MSTDTVTITTGSPRSSISAKRRVTRRPGVFVLALLVTLLYLVPIYWMIVTSFKQSDAIFAKPPSLLPVPPTIEPFISVLANENLLQGLLNTFVIAVGTTILALLLAVPAAYALARVNVPFISVILFVFLAVQMIPAVNLALPMYMLFSKLGLVNTYAGLIIANASLAVPLAITIMRPYFLSLPNEVIEAAKTDGCNSFTAFLRIALPISVPGIVTMGTISFMGAWGEFVFGLSLATDVQMQPATVVLAGMTSQFGVRWNDLMAASTIVALPVLAIFVFLQRYVVSGLTEGATKG